MGNSMEYYLSKRFDEKMAATFALANAEEAVPEENKLLALKTYRDGDPEYVPSITQEELEKIWGCDWEKSASGWLRFFNRSFFMSMKNFI